MDEQATQPITGGGKAVDRDLEPGQVVGEYRVEGKLGEGGFGAVFKAAHPLIGKQVAIKVLSHRFSVDPEMVSRFVAEARAVNQIRHHHIIDIFSFGALEDGRCYYVMEYLDGEPLDRRIARTGRLALDEALPILRPIARALDAAHAKGIAHRDLKAENVFLAAHPDGVFPKLLDFGIAKLLAPEDGLKHKTRTGAPMGTPHYMSPEQCHGRDVDQRTDLYAFGVLAYLMLTGAYPLDGDDYMAILMRQIADEPRPASELVPELPPAVDRALGWLMQKEPAERPPTLIAAVQVLEGAAPGPAAVTAPPAVTVRELPAVAARTIDPRDATRGGVPGQSLSIDPQRRMAPHRWLAIGAAVAAAVIAAVVIYRSGRGGGEGAPVAAVPPPPPPAAALASVAPDAAAPAVDAAPVAAEVYVTITGAPRGTEVRRAGVLVGTAPGRILLARSTAEVMLVLSADGYAPQTLAVVPSQDLAREVKLARKAAAAVAAPKPPPAAPARPGPPPPPAEPTNELEQFPPKQP